MRSPLLALALGLSLVLTPGTLTSAQQDQDFRTRRVEFELRHELLMMPRYDVFDWLYFEVLEKGTVRLGGQVRNAVLKNQAERVAKRVEGVEQIVNDIEILPVSPADDRTRVQVYRALFWGDSPLERYAWQSLNPIHIVVKSGRVKLEGVVATDMDKSLAGFKVREVPFILGVENNLQVEQSQ
jgi:hyperosmotically inducible protein